MLRVDNFIKEFSLLFPEARELAPWGITEGLAAIVTKMLKRLDENYIINDTIAIHKSATIEQHVVLKGPVIIGENSFVGANAYLRGPVFIDQSVKIGPGCELKQSIIFSDSAIAHFNYIGNSLIGSGVNFEAGAIAANHYNERTDKTISVVFNGVVINTHTNKFGALVGDNCKVGANAVLSPGTLLQPGTIVKRLELIEQFRQ